MEMETQITDLKKKVFEKSFCWEISNYSKEIKFDGLDVSL